VVKHIGGACANNGTQLNKYLAHAGVASRREAARLIADGSVRINGIVVKEPGYRVSADDSVEVAGRAIRAEKKIYLLLNKPKDCVTTCSDERGRRTVVSLLAGYVSQRVYPVGRLDRSTTGLLLLTNDGAMANGLTHPRYEVPKSYHVTFDKPLYGDHIAHIKRGVRLIDGLVKVDALRLSIKRRNECTVTLHSGKNRIVRRLFEHLGYRIKKLDRVLYAGISKRGLPLGAWRMLLPDEVDHLRRCVNL